MPRDPHASRRPWRSPGTSDHRPKLAERVDEPKQQPARRPTDRARTSTHVLGERAEALAERFLIEAGFTIVARNVRTPRGEIDRIALEGTALCFIEVRSRSSSRYGSAAASVDARKQARVVGAARAWLASAEIPAHGSARFDVVAVDTRSAPPTCELYRAAFDSGSGRR